MTNMADVDDLGGAEDSLPIQVSVPRVQHRLWLADQLATDGATYLGNLFLRLRGPLDIAALRRALTEIVTRHEVLRTSISLQDGEVTGLLYPPVEVRLPVDPLPEGGLDAAMRAEAATALDITAGPPFRARLVRCADEDHVLSLAVHHTAIDRGSVAILYRELADGYNAVVAGADLEPRPPLNRQFRELAAAADARDDDGELSAALAARCVALRGSSPFELPPDRPRPVIRRAAGALRHGFDLSEDLTQRLTELGTRHAATLFMVLLAGCQLVLHRYTGRTDVTTGTSSSARETIESTEVIGPFLNMVVMPGDVSGNPTFAELVDRTRAQALDAYETRLVPFDSVVAASGIERDPARTPLFGILVDFRTEDNPPALTGLQVTELATPGAGAKYDLSIDFRRTGAGIAVHVEWDTALYEEDTVTRLLGHLRTALVAVAADPALRVDEVPMLSPTEVAELRSHAEPAPVSSPARCLHELFLDQAARTPDAVAVQEGDHTLSYAELDRLSAAIAGGLVSHGVGPDVLVAVLLDRSVDQVATVLGILRAGGAYLPIDPETPLTRLVALLTTAGAPLCVVPTSKLAIPTGSGCRPLEVVELTRASAPARPLPAVSPEHMCSVYFTSGSTGDPKGVACTHRGWHGQLANLQARYRLAAGETLLLKTPLTFDDVAREIFWPLMLGARVVVLPPGLHRDPRAIIAAAVRHRVVWLQFVPSLLTIFLEEIETTHLPGLRLLREVVSDGDRLRPETVRLFFDRLGSLACRLNNHWGTTEVSIDSTHHVCTAEDGDAADIVALGRPMENHEVYVLDQSFQLVPFGVVGEMCIGGTGLARGYLAKPGLTARAFVPHPWRRGERLYRTGDTGRLRWDGALEYRGRRDHQVKVRGVRIELGEVEAAVRAFPGVTDAAVVAWEPVPGDCRLVAYVVSTGGERLRDFLVDRLPTAAVPAVLVALPSLPRLPSGKLDRRALPQPDPSAPAIEPYVVPANDTERVVAGIWATVLGVPRLGATDNFFVAGGHSLLVTRAVNRMRDAFAIDVPVRLVFDNPTVRAVAARVEDLVFAQIEAMSETEAECFLADNPEEEAADVKPW